jgi:glycosyltransferase involved in cell wall biosynthesis
MMRLVLVGKWTGGIGIKGDQFDSQALGQSVHWAAQLPRSELYAVVRQAVASVVPSLVDNLPNSAIESLMLGRPVIAWRGGSLDELVEDGVNGTLVPEGDETALAGALVAAWRGEAPWSGRTVGLASKLAEEMLPEVAAQRLLDLAARE